MKKLVVIIASVFALNNINAQYSNTASIDVSNESVFVKSRVKSNTINNEKLSYSESIKDNEGAFIIQNLENTIAAYNLKEDVIYDSSEKASYSVEFNKKNAKAMVIYDHDGDIITAKEKYKNVKLPYQLAASISNDKPKFYIKNTTVYKKFKKGFGTKTIYKVVISNGNKTKTLKFVK